MPDRENIYENSGERLDAERDRLRSFDIPTNFSIDTLGEIEIGSSLLDIGAGENPGLRDYADYQLATYLAFDIRLDALAEHAAKGAIAVEGDARHLPFTDDSIDTAHGRFVLGHLSPDSRKQMVDETLRVVKPGGKAIFIDYDWTAVSGSPAVNAIRDFTIENIKLFDAAYGSKSKDEIEQLIGKQAVTETRLKSPLLTDYAPLLGLRQITLIGLEKQQSDPELAKQAEAIFDMLEAEAVSDNPPGFYMPDMVAVTVQK